MTINPISAICQKITAHRLGPGIGVSPRCVSRPVMVVSGKWPEKQLIQHLAVSRKARREALTYVYDGEDMWLTVHAWLHQVLSETLCSILSITFSTLSIFGVLTVAIKIFGE